MRWIALLCLVGCTATQTPRPLPDGYSAKVVAQWDCEFTPHTPRGVGIYFDHGGWDCQMGAPPEECLCGDELYMCEDEPEDTIEVVSTGDNSPNIIGNEGAIVMGVDMTVDGVAKLTDETVYLNPDDDPRTKYVDLTQEEHDLFLDEHICPVCKREGQGSTVSCDTWRVTTLMGCGAGFYDSHGEYNPPPMCNTSSYSCRCSIHHRWGMSVPAP